MTGRRLPLAAVLAAACAAAPAPAQERTVTVVAGPEYRAGALKRFLLGREYRDLWTVPARVSVLDLATFAGGLSPTEKGGGNQTVSLRFRGGDGREYAFRSVNKEQGGGLHADLQGTVVQRALQDQVSSLIPAAPLVADALLDAAGVLHPHPRLAVMPDDPRLGEFRAEFAGMLGTIEERPDVGSTGDPVLASAAAIEGTDDFLAALDSSAAHRVDSRDYLAVRLMDLFLNDWDRHEDQFRWARFDSGGVHLWRAVARDRDYALADYDGFIIDLARSRVPNAVRFRGDYRGSLKGLLVNARRLDRLLLAELPRATWDSVTAALQRRLGDAVIAGALDRLPAEYRALQGERLADLLRRRREALPDVAEEFYLELAREAEVHAKAAADRAVVERLADGGVEVSLHAAEGGETAYFRRRYHRGETREVRVFLRAGDDLALVRGAG
ncbi:MAG TPA: hypothetical protein VEW03_10915, partial [Longimicrobiaceae bacterium]|nr:hypothetical protein [Longimicrobiaceae bacterium]